MARFTIKFSESVFLPYYVDNGKMVFVTDGTSKDNHRVSFKQEYEAQAFCKKHRCGYMQIYTKRFEYKLERIKNEN